MRSMSETADPMAPDASPGERSSASGVRRVNNLPLYLLGSVMIAFLVVMMLVAAERAERQNRPENGTAEKVGNTTMFAKALAGEHTGGMIPPAAALAPPAPTAAPAPPIPVTAPILIARPDDLDVPPQPPARRESGQPGQPARDDEAERIRMLKLQRLEEAAKARTGVQIVAPRSAGSPPGNEVGAEVGAPQTRDDVLARLAALRRQADGARLDDPTAAYQTRLAQLRSRLEPGAADPPAGAGQRLPASPGGRNDLAQFARAGQGDRWALDARPEAPRTPFELRAGFVVPATLISGINSALPGQIMAQVAQPVYDTPTGRHLLIPQGARLVGTYSSDVAFGQARVLVAWQRIVFPDGKAMDIGAMPGADGAGYAGFGDRVNNHYVRTFASAFLMSMVTAGITLSQDRRDTSDDGNSQRASDALSEALGQQLGQVAAQMIARNLNVAPTLDIRPGYRFNVTVTRDMSFSRPYQAFDY